MKQRTTTRITGNLGVDAVRAFCERYGFIFQAEPREDYGIDCYLEIATGDRPLNFIVGVQIKSGTSYFRGEDEHRFYVSVSEDDVAYWLAANVPVVFACYLPERDALYLKHVQAYAADMAISPSNIKRIDFDKTSDRAGPELAEYLRSLVAATPSEFDRLEVAATRAPVFVASERRVSLDQEKLASRIPEDPLKLHEIVKINGETGNLDLLGEGKSQVLGFSADGAWVLVLSVQELGSKCSHQELKFINRVLWQELSLPVWTEEDYDSGNEQPLPDVLSSRLAHAQRYVNELKIVSGVGLHQKYQYLRTEEQPLLALEFGRFRFTIDISHTSGRSALVLRASTFRPAREAAVMIERLKPGTLLPWDTAAEPGIFIQPKEFQSICEATLHPRGDLIAFGVLTNAEHGCWGSHDVHHIFLTIEELRELCIGAIRS
jgi:hypothetical protein